jgi:molecular chaperone HscA
MINIVSIDSDYLEKSDSNNGVFIGIDLGTTNSAVSISHNQIAEVLILKDSNNGLIKSSVNINGNLISGFKRYLETPNNVFSNEKTSFELFSILFEQIKMQIEEYLQKPIRGAVITVPARFSNIARDATKLAAQNAGINVIRILNEPTAAAIAYGLNSSNGIFIIYDFGGGTFDATLLRIENSVFQVLATSGDLKLGGDDIDGDIIEFLRLLPTNENKTIAKEIKESFTQTLNSEKQISEEDFEKIVKKYVNKTINITKNILLDLHLDSSEIDGIVLVGGSTRLDYVKKALAKIFSLEKIKGSIDPDRAVAIGAALHAEALTNNSLSFRPLLLDIVPASLGIETVMGCVETIIPKYTPTPVSTKMQFSTFYNNQREILIHIVQGDQILVQNCTSLGKFILKGIQPMPAGQPKIQIIFTVDENGILTVEACEEISGTKQSLSVDFCTNLF